MFTGAWKCRMELNSSGISKFTEKWRISRTSQEFSKRVSGNFPFHSILCWNFVKIFFIQWNHFAIDDAKKTNRAIFHHH